MLSIVMTGWIITLTHSPQCLHWSSQSPRSNDEQDGFVTRTKEVFADEQILGCNNRRALHRMF